MNTKVRKLYDDQKKEYDQNGYYQLSLSHKNAKLKTINNVVEYYLGLVRYDLRTHILNKEWREKYITKFNSLPDIQRQKYRTRFFEYKKFQNKLRYPNGKKPKRKYVKKMDS